MTRNGKWTTFASDLAKLSGNDDIDWEFPRRHSPTCASWTGLILEELSGASAT